MKGFASFFRAKKPIWLICGVYKTRISGPETKRLIVFVGVSVIVTYEIM